MSQCPGCQSGVVPDFTKEGFGGQSLVATSQDITSTHTPESLQQQLSSEGVLALAVSACVGASYSSGKVCFNFPIFGNICINVPIHIPVGAQLKVCASTCGSFIPTGLKITVYVNNVAVYNTSWGRC
ncbi:hypothetical protein FAZ69_22115 [Trinickia terrae]|uniref:Uncharacterized protein n=1 Tax=Trinickia terrae TaxID=2571161 RepID=A0A4U1HZK8_9BURK|nr:hypothetical protein [Trinickia terrae]TKC86004.1 hypothetical protein FAZ69_22115 [Trinickia terrae]